MRAFVDTDNCYMPLIDDKLQGELGEPCGRCANCTGPSLSPEICDNLLAYAARRHYEREGGSVISPRKMTVQEGGEQSGIDSTETLEPGQVFAILETHSWGTEVRCTRREATQLSDDLVEAAVTLIPEGWNPEPTLAWVRSFPEHRMRRPWLISLDG